MRLGIDFGTSSSRAALCAGGAFHFVEEPQKHGFTWPSSTCVIKEGHILVGQAAENRRRLDPGSYKSGFKRDLGSMIPYRLGERELLPEDLVAEVLRKLRTEADKMLGGTWNGAQPFSGVVLTIPATYQRHKLELMRQAAEAAGFSPSEVEFLHEPTAAAIYYSWELKRQRGQGLDEGDILLVYDFGGGTFDAALIQKKKDAAHGYEAMTQALGLERCGGIDFDRAIFNDIVRLHPLPKDERSQQALRDRATLTEVCQEAKHALSEDLSYECPLPHCPGEVYALSRESFNKLIRRDVEETFDVCRQLAKNAGIDWEQVRGALLVGGSCLVPYVGETVKEKLGRPVLWVAKPQLAVCQGAAILGAGEQARQRKRNVDPDEPADEIRSRPGAWRAELVSKGWSKRVIRVSLSNDTHLIEYMLASARIRPLIVKVDDVVVAEGGTAVTWQEKLEFQISDGDLNYAAAIEAKPPILPLKLRMCRLLVAGRLLYTE
jgi:molecular chaperone DnaK